MRFCRWKFRITTGSSRGEYAIITTEAPAFLFLTNLPLQHTNAQETAELGRRRWKMENEGFNTQKRQGYNLEHPYSKDYEALKNHYYLIQIGHMIASWIFP